MTGTHDKPTRRFWLHTGLAVIAASVFLLTAQVYFRAGFPLDDAWIHQTYARNLAQLGEWSFIPGQPSAGSTAPIWSLLLAGGYLLGLMPYIGTYLLGILCLGGLAWAGQRAFASLHPAFKASLPWMGLFLAGEWHLVWAAVSGMETLLIGLVIMLACAELLRPAPRWLLVGGLIGASVWIRPDGLTLLGPALFCMVFAEKSWRARALALAKLTLAFMLLMVPYLLFNHALAGSYLPNTFYAKQAEYAILAQTGLLTRLFALFGLPLIGAGALLLPGLFFILWKAISERNWAVLALFLWWAGYTLIYALRLPVTYQHGRYLMPAMPVYFLLGLSGLVSAERALRARVPRWGLVVSKAWLLSVVLVWLAFFGLGAYAYAQDVAIIETEMVDTARWVAQNTNPGDLIAAHDIGALGYFGGRRLLDLAGLISPEVIPYIRDEEKLADALDAGAVKYLMTFPNWYPQLVERGVPVYLSQGKYAPALGGENMVVYRWDASR